MGTRRVPDRLYRGGWQRLVVVAGLAGFVVAVYVVVVLGGRELLDRDGSSSRPLAVLATAIVALLFPPAQTVLERVAAVASHRGGATPYDVLSRFSKTASGGFTAEELPSRMSMLLAQGTGAAWAQVWLNVSERPTLAATWPADADDDHNPPSALHHAESSASDGLRSLPVHHAGRLLGVLRLQERPGLALTAVEERLFAGLAAQAGLMLRMVGLRTELEHRRAELLVRADELRASRERLIETQDSERRRLERDIHDGAQQHLVALTVNLRLAQTIAVRSPERAVRLLSEQSEAALGAIETLSSLSRGIYPRLLSEEGLMPALRSAVDTSPIPVTVDGAGVGRLPRHVEAALYFCCMEAVQNAAKHSGARSVSVLVSEDSQGWQLTVMDDGAGFDQALPEPAAGSGNGLANMSDRLDAVGGTVTVSSLPGWGTTVAAAVPMNADSGPAPAPVPTPRQAS